MADEAIPTDADHWLFAEDLTNFVFRHHIGFPFNHIRNERDFAREGFSEIVRSAVAIIERNLTQEIEAVFSEMSLKADVVEEFKNYASDMRKSCGFSGFDANKFLHYCVHMSCLGERFYRTGMEEFHFLAFTSVREALKRYDMSNGGWDALDLVSDKITSVGHFDNLPSPEHEPPNYEQSVLNANAEPENINRTWKFLNEQSNPSSECSMNEDSSDVGNQLPDSEESGQSLDIDKYSEICDQSDATSEADSESLSSDDSSSRYLVSLRKLPAQSNVISSSTSISEFHTQTGNAFVSDKIYEEKKAPVSGSRHAVQHFLNEQSPKPLDLSKNSDHHESRCMSKSNESIFERLNFPFDVDQKCDTDTRTASKKVIIPSERLRVVAGPQERNGKPQILFRRYNSERSLKMSSTAEKVTRNRRFSADALESNSAKYISGRRSVFAIWESSGPISVCTPGDSDIEVTESEQISTNPLSNLHFRDTERSPCSPKSK